MKKKRNDFFELGCAIDQTMVSIKIPTRLYNDFENCLKTPKGMSILTTLYYEFAKLSPSHKDTFQMLVFKYKNDIEDIADMIALMKAMVKIIQEKQ